MIELSAAVWKLDLPGTVRKLSEVGLGLPAAALLDSTITTYIEDHPDYRKRVNTFWEQAQRYFLDCQEPIVTQYRQRFSTLSTLGLEPWLAHGGQFIGATDRAAFFKYLLPGQHTGNIRLLKGKNWGDMIVIPFHDLPGRICAFLLIGRTGRPEDHVFYRLPHNFPGPTNTTSHETGLALLTAGLQPPHPQLGTALFVIDDPYTALFLQLRWLKSNTQPLPIVTPWSDDKGGTKQVWEWLPTENVICWSPHGIVRAVKQARIANAQVATTEITPRELDDNRYHRTSLDWLRRIGSHAVPWAVALRSHLTTLARDKIEQTMLDVGLGGAELRQFIQGCDVELRDRLTAIYDSRNYTRHIRFDGRTIYESDNGWHLDPGDDLLCGAVIRIDQILHADTGRSYYRGVIKFQGHEVQFTEHTATLDTGLFKWARDYLLNHAALGRMSYNPRWSIHAMEIAVRFHQPEMVEGVDSIGWSQNQRQFSFPTFAIDSNGTVSHDCACLFNTTDTPARTLNAPEPLSTKTLETLSDPNDEVYLFWATAAAIAHNVIAPALHRSPIGILLDGAGAQSIGAAVAVVLGCPEKVMKHTRSSLAGEIEQFMGAHQWPALLSLSSATAGPWVAASPPCNCLVPVNWATARVLGIRNTWCTLRSDRKLGSMQLVTQAAAKILPAYIQGLCERQLWLDDTSTHLVEAVLNDMAEWFGQQGGAQSVVRKAHRMLELPAKPGPATHFRELLQKLQETGALGFTRAGFERRKDTQPRMLYIEGTIPGIWIPQDMFHDVVVAQAAPAPDTLLITKSLKAEGALLGETVHRDDLGWLVTEQWWNDDTAVADPSIPQSRGNSDDDENPVPISRRGTI